LRFGENCNVMFCNGVEEMAKGFGLRHGGKVKG
jgi:hypothetical protein